MREYELYLVIDADVEEDAVGAIVERTTQIISEGFNEVGGEVIKVEPRGKRRLIYPIKRKVEGQDIILTFQSQPQVLAEIERFLKLDERVLRYLLVRTGE